MKKLIGIAIVLVVLGGIGTYGYLYYKAATQLEVDINEVEITNIDVDIVGGKATLDLILKGTITSPTGINVSIDQGTYTASIEGKSIGGGIINGFTATKEGGELVINYHGDNLDSEVAGILWDLLIMGNDKTITIVITSITFYGITIDTDIVTEQQISRDDIL